MDINISIKNIICNIAWIIFTLLLFGLLFYILYHYEIFNISKGSEDAKIISATIALVSCFFTTFITLLGMLIKRSFEMHSLRIKEVAEKRLKEEASNNLILQKQSENRLTMETALKAIELLEKNTSGESTDINNVGVLFALASLNQLELAMSLLSNLWSSDAIDSECAVLLINKGILFGDKRTQHDAINLLRDNVNKIKTDDNYYFSIPGCFNQDWNSEMNYYVRANMFIILLKIFRSVQIDRWPLNRLLWFLNMFNKIITKEIDKGIICGAILIQEALQDILHNQEYVSKFSKKDKEGMSVIQENIKNAKEKISNEIDDNIPSSLKVEIDGTLQGIA